jgi:hypothetical protein
MRAELLKSNTEKILNVPKKKKQHGTTDFPSKKWRPEGSGMMYSKCWKNKICQPIITHPVKLDFKSESQRNTLPNK